MHRDISPDNIYITNQGQVKLLDFGAARYAMGEHSQSITSLVKPGYSPEEQYRSRGVFGPYSDIYALAATFYRCLTGEIPFAAIDRLVGEEIDWPSTQGIELPGDAEIALQKAMAVKGEDRVQAIEEVQQALNQGSAPKSTPKPQPVEQSADVLNAQERLVQLGYKVALTGVFDARTEMAVKAFELAESIQVTGIIDVLLLQELTNACECKKDLVVKNKSTGAISKSEDLLWRSAIEVRNKTVDEQLAALKDYIDNCPEGQHLTAAIQKMEQVAWERACQFKSVNLFQDYLEDYPNGVFIAEVESKIVDSKNAEKRYLFWSFAAPGAVLAILALFILMN